MALKITMSKQSSGEHFMIEVNQFDPETEKFHSIEEVEEILNKAMKMADDRIYEINLRHLEAYQLERYCSEAIWQKISMVLKIISGELTAARVLDLWKAEREETQELERYRLEKHLQEQGLEVEVTRD